jgi:RNA polymerase sigma-54 factor
MRQEIRLEQKLVLTPQLLLNLRLLGLPTLELEQVIRQELEKNPTLEILPEEEAEEMPEEERRGQERREDEFDLSDFIPEDSGHWGIPQKGKEEFLPEAKEEEEPMESLKRILRTRLKEEDLPYAEYILQSLDEDGLLRLPLEELSEVLAIEKERVSGIIEVLKEIEPGGIGAQTRQEMFLAQLKLAGFPSTSLEFQIIERFYSAFLSLNCEKIARQMRVSISEVKRALANLKSLEPRPLRKYSDKTCDFVEPDFAVHFSGENYSIIFRDERIPHLRISPYYSDVLRNPSSYTREEVEFVREKVREAVSFIKGIEARKRLLLRVVSYIVEKEKDFLKSGGKITPLNLIDCARELRLHPSSVSRAIMRKYLSAPSGIFHLRFFFSSGIGDKPKMSVKTRVKELIENEDPNRPLSDEEIRNLLQKEGVKIARRTVAKYRLLLKIPPSHLRRKNKVMGE